MIRDQKYNRNPKRKEAANQAKDYTMIQQLIQQFGRGEISCEELWVKIEEHIDTQYFRKNLLKPTSAFSEKVS